MRRVLALFKKEYIQIIKDPSSLLIAFVLPALYLILYGAGISLDATNLQIGVVIESNDNASKSLADSLTFSKYFKTKYAQHRKTLYPLLSESKLDGIFIIPFYFNRQINQEEKTAQLQLITDGSDPNTAAFVRNYINFAVRNWLRIINVSTPSKGITTTTRIWFNEELNSQHFIIPGSIAIILTLTGSLLTSLVISREWETGTMESLMGTPISINEIILSKFLAYFVMGIATVIVLYLSVRFGFHVPFRGSFFMLLVVSSAYLSFVLGVGILISAVSKNQFTSTQAAVIVSFLPAFILSGFLFEINSMPTPLRLLSLSLPPRYYVQSLQTLFLAGDIYHIIIKNTLILMIYTLLIFLLIRKKTKKSLD